MAGAQNARVRTSGVLQGKFLPCPGQRKQIISFLLAFQCPLSTDSPIQHSSGAAGIAHTGMLLLGNFVPAVGIVLGMLSLPGQ